MYVPSSCRSWGSTPTLSSRDWPSANHKCHWPRDLVRISAFAKPYPVMLLASMKYSQAAIYVRLTDKTNDPDVLYQIEFLTTPTRTSDLMIGHLVMVVKEDVHSCLILAAVQWITWREPFWVTVWEVSLVTSGANVPFRAEIDAHTSNA